jgi:hypothetical protein
VSCADGSSVSCHEQRTARLLAEVRAGVVERLRARRLEIEQAVLTRVRAVSDPVGDGDAEYLEGLRVTVTAVVDYALTGIELGEEWSGPTPSVAVAHAHRAARVGVGLETVLRCYLVGHTSLVDFVMEEAERGGLVGLVGRGVAARHLWTTHATLLERLVTSIAEEYMGELRRYTVGVGLIDATEAVYADHLASPCHGQVMTGPTIRDDPKEGPGKEGLQGPRSSEYLTEFGGDVVAAANAIASSSKLVDFERRR